MPFVVYSSVEVVDEFRNYTEDVAAHFGSDTMAEQYLNGFINWDGSPTQETVNAQKFLEGYFGW